MLSNLKVKQSASSDTLSRTFAALADPTRRAMLVRLSRGQATVNELAAPFKMSLPAVSKHLKVLEKSGLISRRRDAQMRPCVLEAKAMTEAVGWMEEHRKEWEARFERLEAYLAELQKPSKTKTKKSKGEKHA